MESFKSYKLEKEQLTKKIEKLNESLQTLSEIGIDCEEELEKLRNAVNTIQQDIINVVLVGSFSDGKTSLIAGWLGEKQSNMKIDSDESSDEIRVYKTDSLPDYCKLVDTPGLFGDKEELNTQKKLSEKTEKFIDQAAIIIYVVEAGNPVKDSHKSVLKWILKDLRKIDNTIFVINKMDDVADLTDENEFSSMATIKKNTLKEKLKEIAELNDTEIDNLHILCLSTDPQRKGIEFWEKNREEYEKRSRIKNLEDETNLVLKDSTLTSLVTKTGYDVVSRVVSEKINAVETQIEIIDEIIPELEESIRRDQQDFEHTKEQILKIRPKFLKKLRESQEKLVRQLNETTIEDFSEFMEFNIGIKDGMMGHRIEEQIYLISNDFFTHTNDCVTNLRKKIDYEDKKQNKIYEKAIRKGGEGAAQALKAAGKLPVYKMKSAVSAGKNIINKVFGTSIRFKPWQVTKIAKGITKGFGIAGAGLDFGMEIFDAIKRNFDNAKLEEAKQNVKQLINEIYENVIEDVKDDAEYLKNFAPQLTDIKKGLDEQINAINEQRNLRIAFEKWKKNAIEVEFEVR